MTRRYPSSGLNWSSNAVIELQNAILIRASSFLPEMTVLFGRVGAKCLYIT